MLASAHLQSIWETEAISSDAQKSKFRLRGKCPRLWVAKMMASMFTSQHRMSMAKCSQYSTWGTSFTSFILLLQSGLSMQMPVQSVPLQCGICMPTTTSALSNRSFSEKIGGHSKWRLLSWRDYQQNGSDEKQSSKMSWIVFKADTIRITELQK